MKINKKVLNLINHGLSGKFLSELNEGQIESLYTRLTENKKETKEVTQTTSMTYDPKQKQDAEQLDKMLTGKGYKSAGVDATTGKVTLNMSKSDVKNKNKVISDTEMKEGSDEDLDLSLAMSEKDPNLGLAMMPSEIKEKFESKAQQKYFWAKCNRSKGKEKEKWCKMADEFSKSTTKKDYKKMPEKIHPEKTVKVKKEQKENYMNMIGKALNKGMLMNLDKVSPSVKWESQLEKRIDKILEENLSPKMNKNELINLVSEIKKTKKMLKKTKSKTEVKEQEPTIAPPKPKTPTKPSKPDTPYTPKPGPKPGPKAGTKEIPNWLEFKNIGIKLN